MTVYCASSNRNKLHEFGLIAAHYGEGLLTVEPLPGLKTIEPPEETGQTFAENAALKAAYYSAFVDGLVFADDSGLAVDALGGAPGVYSARYAGSTATDEENNAKVLRDLDGNPDRSARFVCAIAAAQGGTVLSVFEAAVEGEILTQPRGRHGFGYDPLFYYPPLQATFGEATAGEKLLVSHRGKAMEQMIRRLLTPD